MRESVERSSHTTQRSSWRRNDIQGLRAIAVLLVIAFHAGLPIPGGFVGVDVFFVISGFVITELIMRMHGSPGGFHFRTFYARRMKRLLPALALMMSITLLIAIVLESPFGPQRVTATTAIGASFFVANFVIYANTGGYFDAPAELNPLLHTWSLSVEEQFYFIFPALMALAWWLARRRARGASASTARRNAATLLALLTAASFALAVLMSLDLISVPFIAHVPSWAFYSSVTRAWEFGVGALLALGLATRPGVITRARGELLTWPGAALLVMAALWISPTMPFPGLVALIPVAGTALLLAGGAAPHHEAGSAPVVTRALGLPLMVWIGALSYSWYLWHWPVIVFTGTLTDRNGTALLIAAGLSLIPAWLAYRFVEQPLRDSPRIRGRRILILVGTAIAVPTVIALIVISGSNRAWFLPRIAPMAEQITPFPISFMHGCDEGRPLGQQQGLDCSWNQEATGAPIVLIGDSEAGQLGEAVIAAGASLDRPVTIANFNSCAFLIPANPQEPLGSPECEQFVTQSVAWLQTQPSTTVVIGMSPNYISAENAQTNEAALLRTVRTLQDAGHQVVLLRPIPQFFDWTPTDCTLVTALNTGCGRQIPRVTMDDQQRTALEVFDTVATQTGAVVLDLRVELCPADTCATNVGDDWRYRDHFHITVGESQRLTDRVTHLLGRHSSTS